MIAVLLLILVVTGFAGLYWMVWKQEQEQKPKDK